jgi:anthranilate synthase component 2
MLQILNNYAPFANNRVQYFEELSKSDRVFRNDGITLLKIATLNTERIAVSQGVKRAVPVSLENFGND